MTRKYNSMTLGRSSTGSQLPGHPRERSLLGSIARWSSGGSDRQAQASGPADAEREWAELMDNIRLGHGDPSLDGLQGGGSRHQSEGARKPRAQNSGKVSKLLRSVANTFRFSKDKNSKFQVSAEEGPPGLERTHSWDAGQNKVEVEAPARRPTRIFSGPITMGTMEPPSADSLRSDAPSDPHSRARRRSINVLLPLQEAGKGQRALSPSSTLDMPDDTVSEQASQQSTPSPLAAPPAGTDRATVPWPAAAGPKRWSGPLQARTDIFQDTGADGVGSARRRARAALRRDSMSSVSQASGTSTSTSMASSRSSSPGSDTALLPSWQPPPVVPHLSLPSSAKHSAPVQESPQILQVTPSSRPAASALPPSPAPLQAVPVEVPSPPDSADAPRWSRGSKASPQEAASDDPHASSTGGSRWSRGSQESRSLTASENAQEQDSQLEALVRGEHAPTAGHGHQPSHNFSQKLPRQSSGSFDSLQTIIEQEVTSGNQRVEAQEHASLSMPQGMVTNAHSTEVEAAPPAVPQIRTRIADISLAGVLSQPESQSTSPTSCVPPSLSPPSPLVGQRGRRAESPSRGRPASPSVSKTDLDLPGTIGQRYPDVSRSERLAPREFSWPAQRDPSKSAAARLWKRSIARQSASMAAQHMQESSEQEPTDG